MDPGFYTTPRDVNAASIATGIPMRLAIAWGELTHHQERYGNPRLGVDSLVGRALVDAYQAESVQQWSGGVVLDTALNHYVDTSGYGAPSVAQLEGAGLIRPWSIPTSKPLAAKYAIDWTTSMLDISEGAVRDSFADHGKPIDDDDRTARKIQNTVEFALHERGEVSP